MSSIENKQAIMYCIEFFNKCTLEFIDNCYSNKLEWIEYTKASTPEGRKGDLSSYRNFADQLLRLFPDRKLTVLRCLTENGCVVLEQEWEGTAVFTYGNINAGNTIKQRIISFFTLENGLIIKQEDYCI